MRYCSTWLRSLLCYIKKFVREEFVIRVFHCIFGSAGRDQINTRTEIINTHGFYKGEITITTKFN